MNNLKNKDKTRVRVENTYRQKAVVYSHYVWLQWKVFIDSFLTATFSQTHRGSLVSYRRVP